jgi:hypothetical protein
MKFNNCFEATTTRAEFVRLLAKATDDPDLCETAEGFSGKGWRLSLTPLPKLSIGSVNLERYRVELNFDGLDDAGQDAFMRRFTRYYQRGGG